jgi:MFS transporter, SP family, solute carrier family 2 (facilitated glucose transporter), member 3
VIHTLKSLAQRCKHVLKQVVVTTPLMAAVMVAVTLMFLVGYNTGVMNAVEAVVFPGHSVTQWSLVVAVFAIGGPFGAVLAGKVSC